MRHLSTAVLLTSFALPSLGQTPATSPAPEGHSRHAPHQRLGTIVGRVTLADGQTPDHISVLVRGTTHGTTPEADGSFRLAAPAGWQVLKLSGLGYSAQEVTVEVLPGQTVTAAPQTLARGNRQLDEVTVTGNKTLNQRATAVGKLPVAPLDLPQATLTVERQVLEQQQVLHISDALVNAPGVYIMGATGGTQEEIASRGFAYTNNNTFKNGVRYNNAILPETSSLERLEVLKGSAAILYGNVAAGGVLNLVTKKPRFERGGSVGLRVGSFGLVKPTFDVYGALGASQKAAFRLNGSYERADSYRDQVKSNRIYVNPSVLFNLSANTTLLLEGDFLRDRRTPDFGIGAIDYVIQESRSRFLNTSDALNATQQTSATATLTTRLSDTWSVRAIGGFQRYDNELRSAARPTSINNGTMAALGTAGRPGYVPAHAKPSLFGNWGRNLQRTEIAENYYLAEVDLTGQFHTGSIAHVLLVGADADQYNTNTLAYRTQAYDSVNILDPSRKLGPPAGRTTGYDALGYATRTLGNTRRAGFYAQDLVSLLPNVKLLAGLRWSYQETPSDVYTYLATTGVATVAENRRYDNAFSPRLGLVYQPIKNTAVFASYSNSFSPNTGVDVTGNNLAPSIIDQYEVGLKNDLFNGALSANVTLYRIVNSNQSQTVLQNAPYYNPNFPSAQELAGEVTSKGLEVDVQSKPYLGWSMLAGYSYNNTAYTKSTLYPDGSRLRYNPAHTANLSVFYNFNGAFNEGFLRGLSVGATGYYVGDRLAGRNPRLVDPVTGAAGYNDAFKLIALPNYVLFDANVAYSYQRFTLRAKLANILNELSYNVHDDNSINPIAPRTYSATLSVKL
ncbi:TonB-dependent siderophore receptor [Hymenobacter ginsengisoli]|uniref:TonB-dependent siderophore receptor n=1 Tax=Hymenobacter ginsengisoli TaxID=1051626 RepID=A0ABP8QRW3_9BACT|nr:MULTISPECIES: TonB-dependent receptor [unclassified Hymenobacter]MBO2032768.1 TonB-dependent siderophore receptor [Hymenobacter sp. BT559]